MKVKCDASDLQLFLAKRDGAWLRYDDKFKNLIQTNGSLDVMKKMRASWQLMDSILFGEGASLGENIIHVLVVVPPTAPSQLNVSGVTVLVTKSMELNDPPLVAFWNACRKISTDIVADSVIALPEKTFILGQQDLGSRIYVLPLLPQAVGYMSKYSRRQTQSLLAASHPRQPGNRQDLFWLFRLVLSCARWGNGGLREFRIEGETYPTVRR